MKISGFSFKRNIGGRLALGFAAVSIVLALAVGVTLIKINHIDSSVALISEQRVPTAIASATMVDNVHASLAGLRGWMLTGNELFKVERAAVWRDIAHRRSDLDELSQHWTNPEEVAEWNTFKTVLDKFEIAQAKVESIANTPEEHPATQMLVTEAAPHASVMLGAITAMIDAEAEVEMDFST
ncbi:MAG: MCP four helix bundle domain-containing protein [Proteobacteria bacterium]|nr:MCP four helix bundle domain-containing protein [Pseudomonadota bacterium]MDA1354934.1 MCP four helix bundle domain-containing protein [Pseudomonadota bacterium]